MTGEVALLVVSEAGECPVRVSMRADATVDQLVMALGHPSGTAARLRGALLAGPARVHDAGLVSGDTLVVGNVSAREWRRRGPELRVIGGAGFGLRRRVEGTEIVVGRDANADVVLPARTTSRRHAVLTWRGDSFSVRDLGSTGGTFIGDERLAASDTVVVAAGTPVRVGESVITIVAADAAPARGATAPDVPRLEAVPRRETVPRRSITPFVIPSAGAVALAAAAGGAPTPVALAATPAALMVGVLAERGIGARAHRRAENEHAVALAATVAAISAEAERLASLARTDWPDLTTLMDRVDSRAARLWDEEVGSATLRVGLGPLPGVVAVSADDADRAILDEAATARLMPITVPLEAWTTVSGTAEFLDGFTAWLVAQAVARVSPAELELVVISDDAQRWAWTTLLPHGRGRDVIRPAAAAVLPSPVAARRLVVCDRGELRAGSLAEGDVVLARRDDVVRARRGETVITAVAPWRVAVAGHPPAESIVLADALEDPSALAAFALRLAARQGGIDDAGQLRELVTLADLVPAATDADAIVRLWGEPDPQLVASVGVGATEPVRVALAGPNSHVLVGGTTGAGKTRLLESLALGLAAHYPPTALNLLVIDFKGGNELAGLRDLPHCVGMVSDRNASEVDRAIAALAREVARRDEAFAAAGATDRDDYVAKTGRSLPRLVIIADEFGHFRREDATGERIGALLRIAAQGRSKGLHLVLATQSPSTDVTAEIRQNVGVRICLRVAEAAESVAVLGTPEATSLPHAGRVIVNTTAGSQVAQVALSRTSYRAPERGAAVTVRTVDAPIAPEASGADEALFDVVVAAIARAAAAVGATATALVGPPLPESVPRAELAHAAASWATRGLVVGLRDRPGAHDAPPFTFDPPRDGSLLIVGGPRSGRTTALRAVADAAYGQRDAAHPLTVYSVDWGGGLGPFASTPVDGGTVAHRDFEHLRRMVRWLGRDVPGLARLVLVDRLDLLVRDLRELDGGALVSELLEVLQSGPRRRVHPVATLDPSALAGGALHLGGARVVLPVTDPTSLVAAGLPKHALTTPGRGLALPDGDSVQVGLPAALVREGAPPAACVAPLPTRVGTDELELAGDDAVVVGLGGDATLAPLRVDLAEIGPTLVVIGRAGSGRTTALATLAASYAGTRRVVRVGADTEVDFAGPPALFVADDAVRLSAHQPWIADGDLAETLRAGGHVLVAAFDQALLYSLGYSHWLMRRPTAGLLLALDATPDRVVACERVGFHPPSELRAGPPGRGWWCARGRGVPVQVAIQ